MRNSRTWILVGFFCLGLMAIAGCDSPQPAAEIDTPDVSTEMVVVDEARGKQPASTVVPPTETTVARVTEGAKVEETEPAIELTQLVADLLASPAVYSGEEVTIVGVYQGWDWQGQVGTGPPVTRSDWVLADASGAIYVAALGGQLGALEQELGDRDRVFYLMVKGVMRISERGEPYLEPLEIELLGERRN